MKDSPTFSILTIQIVLINQSPSYKTKGILETSRICLIDFLYSRCFIKAKIVITESIHFYLQPLNRRPISLHTSRSM